MIVTVGPIPGTEPGGGKIDKYKVSDPGTEPVDPRFVTEKVDPEAVESKKARLEPISEKVCSAVAEIPRSPGRRGAPKVYWGGGYVCLGGPTGYGGYVNQASLACFSDDPTRVTDSC